MKPEELQIGDWVWYNPNVFNEDEYELPKECYPTKIESGEDIDLAIEGCYEPIPLTTEILLKNGLERDSFGRIWGAYFEEDEHERLEITVDDKTSEIWWSYNWDEYRIIKLEYLRQLQNAMRLCGIDKEIKL